MNRQQTFLWRHSQTDVDTTLQAIKRLLPPERISEIECFIVTYSMLGYT